MKGQLDSSNRSSNRFPPPVVIRRKQIPLRSTSSNQQDWSIADSSISDEGVQSIKEEFSDISETKDRRYSFSDSSRPDNKPRGLEFLLENEVARARLNARPQKWNFLSKSASTNGTARIFAEGGGTISTSSSSYDHDLQSLLGRPGESSGIIPEIYRETGTSIAGRFASGISGSTSSELQEESEVSFEEKDALIEGVKTPLTICRNRIPKFGARRKIVATAIGSSSKNYYPTGGDPYCVLAATSSTGQQDIHLVDELQTERDIFTGDLPGSSQQPTSAPTALSLGKKLTSWKKESKDLLVKSVSTANTLTPTTMTCIKSPRAMSEHLLGQLDVPVAPGVLGALRVKGGSLKENDRGDKTTDVPRQRWSSVKIKGNSTKSLLLENGGPQPTPLKGALRKEVYS